MKQPSPDLDALPELDMAHQIADVPPRLAAALDAKSLEQAMLVDMAERCLELMKPEMERAARQILLESARQYWRHHAVGQVEG